MKCSRRNFLWIKIFLHYHQRSASGEQHFYRLTIADGKKERITTMTGANQVSLSRDEKYIAVLYSYSNKPWELYLQENCLPAGRQNQPTNTGNQQRRE
ncbi:MAG: hypothetical protein WDO71_01475 [Bacteroidota bacterium]